jgi:hypothetical protein
MAGYVTDNDSEGASRCIRVPKKIKVAPPDFIAGYILIQIGGYFRPTGFGAIDSEGPPHPDAFEFERSSPAVFLNHLRAHFYKRSIFFESTFPELEISSSVWPRQRSPRPYRLYRWYT